MNSLLQAIYNDITHPTETKAVEAAGQARKIAAKHGLPESSIQTAEAAAIGAVCAQRQYESLP